MMYQQIHSIIRGGASHSVTISYSLHTIFFNLYHCTIFHLKSSVNLRIMIINLSVHVRISFKINHVIARDKLLSLVFGRFTVTIFSLQPNLFLKFQDCTISYRNFTNGGPLGIITYAYIRIHYVVENILVIWGYIATHGTTHTIKCYTMNMHVQCVIESFRYVVADVAMMAELNIGT